MSKNKIRYRQIARTIKLMGGEKGFRNVEDRDYIKWLFEFGEGKDYREEWRDSKNG